MRLTLLLTLALFVFNTHAEEVVAKANPNIVPFDGVQTHCVQVGDIKFGAGEPWGSCEVTRGRWVATIDLIDMYQAQYCLSDTKMQDAHDCKARAWVLFGNRAYTPGANAMVVRVDEANTIYEDPQVVIIGDKRIMSMPSHVADQASSRYFLWRGDHWVPIESQAWQQDLLAQLPKDTALRQTAWPELSSMTAEAVLFKTSDADCCPTGGVAMIEFGFDNEKFTVKKVNVSREKYVY